MIGEMRERRLSTMLNFPNETVKWTGNQAYCEYSDIELKVCGLSVNRRIKGQREIKFWRVVEIPVDERGKNSQAFHS